MFEKKKVISILLLFAVLGLSIRTPIALAQNYHFNLRENRVALYINADGTVQIVYDLMFVCDPTADAIDIVDIGLPNGTYRLDEVRASIGGVPLNDISESPYVDDGVAVELGSHEIRPGQSGILHLEAIVRNMIYQDDKDDAYASIEFIPTYFDSEFVYGATVQDVRFYFPPGLTEDEPRYHKEPFTQAYFEDGRAVYRWVREDAKGDSKFTYGASFPKQYVAEGVVQKAPTFTFDPAAICSNPLAWIVLFGGGWAFLAALGSRAKKRRKMKYLPPSLAVEGTGVKRGLTAVEAAILLEAPLDKVLTMILFGLVKKGLVTVESEKPLKINIADPLPQDAKTWYYERRFLKAIGDDGRPAEGALRDMVIDLIGDVNKKLAGFSRRETKAYYRDVAARAWQQVEASDTPEVLGARWSDGLEWTMLDDDWDDRTREVFHDRPVVLPHWWWGYRPWVTRAGRSVPSSPLPSTTSTGRPVTLPTLPGATFANTVVSGIENAANTVVSGVESFTGKITQTTNPPPKTSSSSSRGGGYSCACACACAGCACACAGGGR